MEEEKEVLVAVLRYEDKFLIMKRAESCRYDPGRWEFVSMMSRSDKSVQNLEEQVFAETGLKPLLIKKDEPFNVDDEYGKWLVRPFLFDANATNVTLDSDHSEYRWVNKAEFKKLETVADLEKNLEALRI